MMHSDWLSIFIGLYFRQEIYRTFKASRGVWSVPHCTGSSFSIGDKATHHDKIVPSHRMSWILTEVRVALATSDVQSTLEVPAADDIHMEDRNHGLA